MFCVRACHTDMQKLYLLASEAAKLSVKLTSGVKLESCCTAVVLTELFANNTAIGCIN